MIKADGLYKITNYNKVTNDDCPSFSGIVAGECKGDLWVDHVEHPTIAIANSYAVGSFAFLGDIESSEEYNNVKVFINEGIFPQLKLQGIDYFEFSIESERLREPILQMFGDKEMQKAQEFRFRKKDATPELLDLPEGYTVHKVDMELWNLIKEGTLENGSLVAGRILGSWENANDFFEKSLAFCITHLNKIIAVIVGTARFNNVIAIDIATEEAHRNKGLGQILTGRFVNECVRRGLVAQWDCMKSNPASRKLAEKAGFKFIKQNEVYWFKI